MRITEVEIHEFEYLLEDVGVHDGNRIYDPGSTFEPPGFVLTIRTDTGIEGHYRGFNHTGPQIKQVEMATPGILLGRDPLEREGIWQDYWNKYRHSDHFGLGPIDIALWDLAGKHYGESVASLLGGYRDSVPAYASTHKGDDHPDGLSSPEAYADFAEGFLEQGYPAFKFHPFGDPDRDIEVCRAVAERVGDEMDLMIDPSSRYQTYAEALKVGRVLDELDFFWYEDPLQDTGEAMGVTRRLVEELDTPVLGVEHVRGGPFSRANHLANDALEMVRADAHLDGGITGVMKIAHLTEAFGFDVELHTGGPSHLHCMSAIRNTNYFEHGLFHPHFGWMGEDGFVEDPEQVNDDGTIDVPDGPGLGVEIDWDLVEGRLTDHTVFE